MSRTGQLDVGGEVNDSASSGTKNDRINDGATATGFLDWNDQAGVNPSRGPGQRRGVRVGVFWAYMTSIWSC